MTGTTMQRSTAHSRSAVRTPAIGVVVATCLAAGTLCGCGASVPGGWASPPQGTEQARDVFGAYVTAIVDRDPYEACAQLTPELREQLMRTTARANPDLDTCHEILATAAANLRHGVPAAHRARVLKEMRDAGNIHVEVDGTKARAWLQLPDSSESSTNVELVHEGGTWRISSVGLG
jgi:hypothetical protein